MKLGIGTFTYSWAMGIPGYDSARPRLTLPELLERAAVRGCRVVQICDNAAPERLPPSARAGLRRQAEAAGLEIQLGTRGILPDHLEGFLPVCGEYACTLVRSMLPREGDGAELDDAVAMLREIMPDYESAGVALSLENHDRHRCHELLEVLERVGSPSLGICLDTANSYGTGEDSFRVVDTLLPAANCLHIKDYAIRRISTLMGFHLGGTPAGRGMLDISRILADYAARGGDRAVILEMWTPFVNDLDETIALEYRWTEESLAYLRPFFQPQP